MTTLFQFMILWESLDTEEKAYLTNEFEYGSSSIVRYYTVQKNPLTPVEERLVKRGILEVEYPWRADDDAALQVASDYLWVFTGLKISASMK